MASKGQKFNSYIFDIKEMVLDEYKEKHNIKYLSTIIDLYNRHVVAYKISKKKDNKLVIDI